MHHYIRGTDHISLVESEVLWYNYVLQISEIRGQLKAQQKITDATDDPDSRMDTDRSTDRRDKKNPGGGGGGAGASGCGGGKGAKMGSRGAGKGLWPK